MTATSNTAMADNKPHQRRQSLEAPTVTSQQPDDTEVEQPYSNLLMPEPPPDHDSGSDERIDDIQFNNYILFRGKRNKDWRSIPVFPDDDGDLDEPLSPLLATSDSESEDEGDYSSTPPSSDSEESERETPLQMKEGQMK